jgi:hypothetical protein
MQFSEWYSIIEASVKVVAPHEIVVSHDPVRTEGGMLFKTPLFVAAAVESMKQGARYAYEADCPDDFFTFSRTIASQFTAEGRVFRDELIVDHPAHWPIHSRVIDEWRLSSARYDKQLSRHGYLPIVVAADIEQMVIYEQGPFASFNTWIGKLLAASILKQNGFAPPLIVDKAEHDQAIRCFKSWVTFYEQKVKPIQKST